MFEKLIIGVVGVAGLAAAFVEATKHIQNFWDAMEIEGDEDWNNYVKSFRYEPPGQVEIVHERYTVTVSDCFQISDLYEKLNQLSVYTRKAKPEPGTKTFTLRLLKADGKVLEITFKDAGLLAEEDSVYPVLSYMKFAQFVDGMRDDSDF